MSCPGGPAWRWILPTLLALTLLASTAGGQEAVEATETLMKVEGATGTEVVERELRGQSVVFPEGARVYFFTRVSGARPGSRLLHVWYREARRSPPWS